jgi:hypothetical protein
MGDRPLAKHTLEYIGTETTQIHVFIHITNDARILDLSVSEQRKTRRLSTCSKQLQQVRGLEVYLHSFLILVVIKLYGTMEERNCSNRESTPSCQSGGQSEPSWIPEHFPLNHTVVVLLPADKIIHFYKGPQAHLHLILK